MYDKIVPILNEHRICIRGVLHIGANDCEEIPFYTEQLELCPTEIIWMDAFQAKVASANRRGIANVYHATITNKDDDVVDFHIMRNNKRSTIVPIHHNDPDYIYRVSQSTLTVPTFLQRNQLSAHSFNFWNIHIEGAEILALQGAAPCMKYVDAICVDSSNNITEIDEFLEEHGFSRAVIDFNDAFYIKTPSRE